MHLIAPTSAVLLSLLVTARASPVPVTAHSVEFFEEVELAARAGVNFHILVGTPLATLTGSPDDEKCGPNEVAVIKNAISDAKAAAAKATRTLSVSGMSKSNGYFWIFETDVSGMTKRLAPAQNGFFTDGRGFGWQLMPSGLQANLSACHARQIGLSPIV